MHPIPSYLDFSTAAPKANAAASGATKKSGQLSAQRVSPVTMHHAVGMRIAIQRAAPLLRAITANVTTAVGSGVNPKNSAECQERPESGAMSG